MTQEPVHPPALDLPPPPRLLPDGYEWVQKLSEGGMSELYLARRAGRRSFAKLFVIKLLRDAGAAHPARVARMISEARLTAELNHPNLVQVIDAGQLGERAFIVMEYLHGVDLRAILERLTTRDAPVPVGIMCRIVADALAGLEHAHAQPLGRHKEGIIHGDVSPSNVMVTFAGHTKIIDFGIARDYTARGGEPVGDGRPEGKPPYMSPEQALCLVLDRRSDVFSAGIVLWEALAGRRLFARKRDSETLAAVLAAPVTPPSHFNQAVPAALDAVVLRALARDRAQRYPTAGMMRAELERLIARSSWPASSADVEAWLAALFSDRLQAERSSIDRVGAASYEQYLLSTGTNDSGVVAGEIAGESSAIPIIVELPAAATNARRRRLPLVAGAAAALLLFAVGALTVRGGSRHPQPILLQPAPAATARTAAAMSAPALPAPRRAEAPHAVSPASPASPTSPSLPPQAALDLRADHRCDFFIDGRPLVTARHAQVVVDAARPHTLSYRRVDHGLIRTLDVPPLAAGEVHSISVRVAAPGEP